MKSPFFSGHSATTSILLLRRFPPKSIVVPGGAAWRCGKWRENDAGLRRLGTSLSFMEMVTVMEYGEYERYRGIVMDRGIVTKLLPFQSWDVSM